MRNERAIAALGRASGFWVELMGTRFTDLDVMFDNLWLCGFGLPEVGDWVDVRMGCTVDGQEGCYYDGRLFVDSNGHFRFNVMPPLVKADCFVPEILRGMKYVRSALLTDDVTFFFEGMYMSQTFVFNVKPALITVLAPFRFRGVVVNDFGDVYRLWSPNVDVIAGDYMVLTQQYLDTALTYYRGLRADP